ncbi:MAG: hypothetical protein ACRDRQ_01170 [Pseudonocardiaceae bacterium]
MTPRSLRCGPTFPVVRDYIPARAAAGTSRQSGTSLISTTAEVQTKPPPTRRAWQ